MILGCIWRYGPQTSYILAHGGSEQCPHGYKSVGKKEEGTALHVSALLQAEVTNQTVRASVSFHPVRVLTDQLANEGMQRRRRFHRQ